MPNLGKKFVYRFAFGEQSSPGSSVWRVWKKNQGDVYLSNSRDGAHEIHISLHSSGRNSMKTFGQREKFPLMKFLDGRKIAFRIVYRKRLAPLASTKSRNPRDVIWLGNPGTMSFLVVTFFYQNAKQQAQNNALRYLFSDVPTFCEKKASYFHAVLEEIPYSMDNLREMSRMGIPKLNLNAHGHTMESLAEAGYEMDLFHFNKSSDGIPTIFYHPFAVQAS